MTTSTPSLILNNGLKFPQIGLGTWQTIGQEMKNVIRTAIDLGYRHIDSAFCYGNEDIVGEAIREKIAEGVVKREDIFITTKLWITEHEPDKIIPACKRSVETLGLGYIDLYLVHWPVAFTRNYNANEVATEEECINTTLEEKWMKMEECVKLGLVKSIGISNYNTQQIEAVLKVAKIKPVTNQIECHPYFNQKKLIAFCKERDITITAYAPLGSPYWPENAFSKKIPNILEEPIVIKLGEKYKKTPGQIILRYLIQLGTVVIPKSSNPQRMKDNLNIFDFNLNAEELSAMDSLNKDLRSFAFETGRIHKYYPFDIEY